MSENCGLIEKAHCKTKQVNCIEMQTVSFYESGDLKTILNSVISVLQMLSLPAAEDM